MPSESVILISSGLEFHNLADATENALSSYVLVLVLGTCNRLRPADLSDLSWFININNIIYIDRR
jgi:hypothetical protein